MSKRNSVAVIMSVYLMDRLEYLQMSVESVRRQDYSDIDIYIHLDGEVCHDILNYLEELSGTSENVFIKKHENNLGLARRLNDAIDEVLLKNKYKYIARMDADDICMKNRISAQVEYLESHLDIDIVGSDVIEINDMNEEVFYKSMEPSHEKMVKNIIKKCPFNHPSVMFRAEVFLSNVRYDSNLKNTQDYYLWVNLIKMGYKFSNINEPLLKFRVSDSFHDRRGLKKAMNDVRSRIYAFNTLNNANMANVVHVAMLFMLRIAPKAIKKIAYQKLRS